MKILLDECVTKRLKPYLPGHEVLTVTEKRWNGLKNGQLLEKAVEDNFDLLLTIDKNIIVLSVNFLFFMSKYSRMFLPIFHIPSSIFRCGLPHYVSAEN